MNTRRKFWLVLVVAILIMGIIACSCNPLSRIPAATHLPPQPTSTEEVPTLTLPPVPSATFAAAATGKIAFSSDRTGYDAIYVINVDGSQPTQLTNNQAGDRCPVWSPDGQKIAFSSDRDGSWQIYVMNADGSQQTRLTNGNKDDGTDPYGHCAGITWSPDGQKIAFTSDRDGNSQAMLSAIYVMNANGSKLTRLTNPKDGDTAPAWSPDGQKIAFSSIRVGAGAIAMMNTDGSHQTLLTDSTGGGDDPAWSPDGKKIAFNAGYNDPNAYIGIYVMNADGSQQTLLTSCKKGDERFPAWSPDGQKIAFYSYCNGNVIYVMNADGSNQTQLSDYQSNSGFTGISWSK